MELSNDLSEFVQLLNENDVKYLLVGAWAVAYHSIPRYTGDIDFFIARNTENAQKILKVLAEFGFSSLDITVKDLTKPNFVVQIGQPPNRIDLLTSIDGVEFEDAWKSRIQAKLGGTDAILISIHDLIQNKKAAGRPRDLMDVDSLERIRELTVKKNASSPPKRKR